MIIDQRAMRFQCCFLLQRPDETYVYCTAASDEVDPFLCPEHRLVVSPRQGFEYRDSPDARRMKNEGRRRARERLYELLGHGPV